jgi:hypothetical protein
MSVMATTYDPSTTSLAQPPMSPEPGTWEAAALIDTGGVENRIGSHVLLSVRTQRIEGWRTAERASVSAVGSWGQGHPPPLNVGR